MRGEHDWVEIALDYRCNLRCLGCRACEDTGESLSPGDVLEILREARAAGVEKLWLGGGEPTLRRELPSIIASARKLGFQRVLLQTNGVRLAYAPFTDALVSAGVTEVSFNVKTHVAATHDALSGVPGAHAHLLEGIANARRYPVVIAADVLLARATIGDLPATVRAFAARGVTRFTLWLLSAADTNDPLVTAEVPSLSEVSEHVRSAGDVARELGVELVSLHTPPCTLPEGYRQLYLPAAALRLVVIDPAKHAFPLEASPFEGGTYAEGCGRCASRPGCSGARADYLALHGAVGLEPL